MTSPLIDIGQMIDLACGTPEMGIINFGALHALLHVLARQIPTQKCRIEFSGGIDGITNMVRKIPPNRAFDVVAYSAESDNGTGTFPKRKKIQEISSADAVDTILVIKRNPTPASSKTKQYVNKQKVDQPEKKGKTDQKGESQGSEGKESGQIKPITIPSNEDFRTLDEDGMDDDKVAALLPDNAELTSSLESQSPVHDMWNMINVTKRLDAAEITIRKVITMIADMGKEYSKVSSKVELSIRSEDLMNIKDQLDNIEQKIHKDADAVEQKPSPSKKPYVVETVFKNMVSPRVNPNELPNLNRDEIDTLKSDVDYIKMAVQKIALCSGQKDIANFLTKDIKDMKCLGSPGGMDFVDPSAARNDEDSTKLRAMEKNFEMLERRLVTSDKRIYDLEKEFGEIHERVEDVVQAIEAKADQNQDAAALYAQVNELKVRLVSTTDRCNMLTLAKESLVNGLDDVLAKLKLIEDMKIDREEVDELLAEKADYNLVQRKVSNDNFDATKREIGHEILETMNKLAEQEETFKQQMDELRRDINNKLHKSELEAIRETFFSKLQIMQDRMKALSMSRREPEAAATKTKFLRDVQCLSCEQKVIMRKEVPAKVPKTEQMVAMKSMKPQLTYDLDNLRRELYTAGNSRNMHHFETLSKGAGQSGCPPHPCKRYCGGSHTAISPQENFQRRNFPKQPERKPTKADNLVRGTDGTFYKASPFQPCPCTDGPYPTPPNAPASTPTPASPTAPATTPTTSPAAPNSTPTPATTPDAAQPATADVPTTPLNEQITDDQNVIESQLESVAATISPSTEQTIPAAGSATSSGAKLTTVDGNATTSPAYQTPPTGSPGASMKSLNAVNEVRVSAEQVTAATENASVHESAPEEALSAAPDQAADAAAEKVPTPERSPSQQ